MLVTIDVGSTLGAFAKPDCIDTLATIAEEHQGATRAIVAEICRWKLHVAPKLTEQLVATT